MKVSVPFFGLLFDSDGTVVDSLELTERHYAMLASELGLGASFDPSSVHGVLSREVLGKFFAGQQLEDALERLQEIDMTDFESLRPMPGAVDFVASLHRAKDMGREIPWGVVTSAPLDLVKLRWQYTGIKISQVIVGAEHVSQGKPHPEPFLVGWRQLGERFGAAHAHDCQVFPEDPAQEKDGSPRPGVVVFEDSAAGLEAGKAAGCVTVAVTASSGLQGKQLEHADYVVHDLSQVTLGWRAEQSVLRIEEN